MGTFVASPRLLVYNTNKGGGATCICANAVRKWYYTIEYPAADGSGRKRVERVGGTTYAQAAKAYRQAMAALDDPEHDAEPAMEVMPFFLEWLEKDVEINLGPNTYDAIMGSSNGISAPVSAVMNCRN